MIQETVRVDIREQFSKGRLPYKTVIAVFPDGKEAIVDVEFDDRSCMNIFMMQGNKRSLYLSHIHPDIKLQVDVPKPIPRPPDPEFVNHPLRTGKL